MANFSIDKKILFLVGGIFILFVIALTGLITTTSINNLTQVKQGELDRASRILASRIADMEQNAVLAVRNFEENEKFAEELKLLTNFGPYYADPGSYFLSDYLTAQTPIESADQIYALRAQLTLVQLLQSIQRINNLTSISFYALPPFDLAPDLAPVLVLRLDETSIDVTRFTQKGNTDSRLVYQITKADFVPPSPDYFDISSAYSAPPEQFFSETGFAPTTAALPDEFFPQSWQKADEPRSEIIIKDGIPVLQTWYPVTIAIPHPETWEETAEPVGLALVEQKLDTTALNLLQEQLGLDVGLSQDGRLLLTTLDNTAPSDAAPRLLPTTNRIEFADGEFFFRQHPITLSNSQSTNLTALVFNPLSELTALTSLLPRQIGLTAVITMILAGLLVYFTIRYVVTRPLATLLGSVQQITAGDLTQIVQVKSQDELGTLAVAFNSMTTQLRDLVSTLEQRVAGRTRALATSAEISRSLSTILDTNQLIQEVVTQIQQAFQLYHVHIYLFDEAQEKLVMVGGTGQASATMLAQGHAIAKGIGLVGQAADRQTAIFVSDVMKNPNWLPNPLLPATKAEVAIPIMLRQRMLGVLDVQHNELGVLNEENVELLQSIANQVAIALQNARQYKTVQESQQDIRERETLLRTIIDSTPDWIFVKDINHRYLLANQGYANSFHMSPDNFIGRNDLDIGFPQEIVKGNAEKGIRGFWADDREIMDSGQMKVIPEEPAVVDGQPRVLSAIKAPLRNATGEITGLVGFVHDITNLKQAEATLAKQANALAAVAEVSTAAATILQPDHLLQDVIDLTKERFALYHAHIFLLDENQRTLTLTAGAGDVGRQMVAEGRRISFTAQGSLIATVARERQGAIRNYEAEGEGFMPHPLLLNTRAEMAVPIILGETVLGVLDVRAATVNHFDAADLQTFTSLAAQIAVALQNARSFAQAEEAVNRLNILTRRLTREGWDNTLRLQPGGRLAYGYDLQRVTPLGADALQEDAPTGATLVQPLQVHGEEIGALALTNPGQFAAEAREIIATVSARLSAHIENLRLSEQTERALTMTETLYAGSDRVVRATTIGEVLAAVTESTILKQFTLNSIHLFDHPWEDIPPAEFILAAHYGDAPDMLASDRQPFNTMPFAQLMKRDEIVIVEDLRTDARLDEDTHALLEQLHIRSAIFFPLIVGDQWFGVLIANHTAPITIGAEDIRQISSLTDQAAVVIQSLNLYEEAQTRAQRERLLREVSDRIYAAPDMESVLRTTARELQRIMGLESFAYMDSANAATPVVDQPPAPTNGHKQDKQ
ncbi:MAG: GAF domain-containing protein [Anaerolinea sp.]|nr:GAF domain-containing protein [Anaerolinea sp.]